MGLSKTIIQRNGVPAEYHRISGVRFAKGGMYEVGVQSFFTKKDMDEGKRMVDEQIVFLPAEKINDAIASHYKSLKELPDYADAKDVFEEPEPKEDPVSESEGTITSKTKK